MVSVFRIPFLCIACLASLDAVEARSEHVDSSSLEEESSVLLLQDKLQMSTLTGSQHEDEKKATSSGVPGMLNFPKETEMSKWQSAIMTKAAQTILTHGDVDGVTPLLASLAAQQPAAKAWVPSSALQDIPGTKEMAAFLAKVQKMPELQPWSNFVNQGTTNLGMPGMPGAAPMPGETGMPGMPGMPAMPGKAPMAGKAPMPGKQANAGKAGWPGMPGGAPVPGQTGLPGIAGMAPMPGQIGLPGMQGRAPMPGQTGLPGIPDMSNFWNNVLRMPELDKMVKAWKSSSQMSTMPSVDKWKQSLEEVVKSNPQMKGLPGMDWADILKKLQVLTPSMQTMPSWPAMGKQGSASKFPLSQKPFAAIQGHQDKTSVLHTAEKAEQDQPLPVPEIPAELKQYDLHPFIEAVQHAMVEIIGKRCEELYSTHTTAEFAQTNPSLQIPHPEVTGVDLTAFQNALQEAGQCHQAKQ